MKVTDLRRKVAASLVAGGLLIPVAKAADLDVNLVTNPGFENVNLNSSQGGYNAVEILDWTAGTATGFAYSHNGSLDGSGATIPDYANGGIYTGGSPPTGTGSFYFTSNATPGDITGPGQVSQNIDVASGASGALISSGEAAVSISGYFSSYLGNGDFGTIQVDFLDAADNLLGSAGVSDSNVSDWTLDTGGGFVPVGTQTARVSVYGTPLSGGPDGYIDNVDVRVTSAEGIFAFLEVNTATGEAVIRNNTGAAINIDYYEIMSNEGTGTSLQPGNGDWLSLQDQNAPGFPTGNGSGNGWEEAGGSDSGTLSESYLTGFSTIADQGVVPLGAIFNSSGSQDLTFRYGQVVSESTDVTGDYNNDGTVNIADYTVWRNTLGASVTAGTGADGDNDGTIGVGDYVEWKENFGSGSGKGDGQLVTGFVRYITSGSVQTVGVPEPGSVVIVSIALTGVLAATQRQRRNS